MECWFTVRTNQFANNEKRTSQHDRIQNAAIRELSRSPRVESPNGAVNQLGPGFSKCVWRLNVLRRTNATRLRISVEKVASVRESGSCLKHCHQRLKPILRAGVAKGSSAHIRWRFDAEDLSVDEAVGCC
jgi:hypothetical protein